jgi:hypothetical protein
MHRPQVERQKIEEECPFGFRRDRKHVSARAWINTPVNILEVRRLAAVANAVVNDLAMDLLSCDIYERHVLFFP